MSDKEKKPRKSPEKKAALSTEEPKKAKKEKAVSAEAAPKKKKKKDAVPAEPIGEITAASETAQETVATQKNPPAHWEIAERAHRYFVERGYKHGFDAEDWLRAERELSK